MQQSNKFKASEFYSDLSHVLKKNPNFIKNLNHEKNITFYLFGFLHGKFQFLW